MQLLETRWPVEVKHTVTQKIRQLLFSAKTLMYIVFLQIPLAPIFEPNYFSLAGGQPYVYL